MGAGELTLFVTAVANALAEGLSEKKLNLLGAVFTQLGDTLATIAAQTACCEKSEPAPRSDGDFKS